MSILDKASLIQIPSGYKSTKLYSLRPSNGDGDFTFARASTGTRVNSEGLIEEVPYNLASYSEDYTNSLQGASTTFGTITSPTNKLNASTITTTANGTYKGWFESYTLIGSTDYTFSFYVKYNNKQWLSFYHIGSAITKFDVQNGVFGNNSIGMTKEDVGDGWYRLSGTVTASSGTNYFYVYNSGQNDQNSSVGDAFYLFGIQLVKGTTAKTYFPTTDRLNVPRLDYSGGATCASLLLEGQSTNLIRYSESFENSWWQKLNNVTVSGTKVTSPDGTLNASQLIFDGTSDGRIEKAITGLTSGADYSVSVYARVSSGTQVVSFGSVNVESFTLTTEWQRLTRTEAENDTVGYPRFICDDAATIEVWGFQLEQGSYPTSYIISNSGSSTTRTADVCNNAGTSATFNDSEGVLFFEGKTTFDSSLSRRVSISDGSISNRVSLEFDESVENTIKGFIDGIVLTYAADNLSTYNKIALQYKSGAHKLWINGNEVQTSTSANIPSGLDRLSFDGGDGSNDFYGNTKQLMVFNEALSDEELSDLTGQVNLSFNNLATFYNYTIL